MFHIFLHIVLPLAVAVACFRPRWKFAYFIMMATMLVDIDHLLANPIYDPLRCSVGFHPLHRLLPIAVYILLSVVPKTRLVGLGLMIHMALDSLDCKVNTGEWMHHFPV
ncbi:MAG: hypothetical protein CSB47_09460 [Proteobacteria bacterium]|nr:MAG: hypothetical protein CSB47_09460 [Pseudomonadota bacterium]